MKEGSKAEEKKESPKKEVAELKAGVDKKKKKKSYFPSSDGVVKM